MIIALSILCIILFIIAMSLGVTANNYKEAYNRLSSEHKDIIVANVLLREKLGKKRDKTKP